MVDSKAQFDSEIDEILNFLKLKEANSPDTAVVLDNPLSTLYSKHKLQMEYIAKTPENKYYIDRDLYLLHTETNSIYSSSKKYENKGVRFLVAAIFIGLLCSCVAIGLYTVYVLTSS